MAPAIGTAMATARAEQGMLEALAAPRVTVGGNPFIKSQPGLSALARPETVASDPYASKDSFESRAAAPQNNLKLDRRQHSDEKLPILPSGGTRAKQEILREIDEVRTLHHQPVDIKLPRSGFEKLRRKQDERRQRDARAIEVFEAGVAAISERMEQHVLDVSYTLREGLEEAEGAVNVIREELGRDDVLVCGDMEYVEDMWFKLEVQCKRRSCCIQRFREGLEGVETRRSAAVGEELQRLIDDMVSIARRMPDEIERIAEEHAAELNGVLISNRLAHAELLATMEKADFVFAVGTRRAWEIRRDDWRHLRHNRAISCFRSDLQSAHFTNPPERVALFTEFKEGQLSRHAARVALLQDLCQRRPDSAESGSVGGEQEGGQGTLTVAAVSGIRERYTTLHKDEIAAIREIQERLARIRDAKLEEAKARRELLRAELHGYGALSAKPNLEGCCLQVEIVANSQDLEDFMRKAGGMKRELLALLQGMRSPDVMYKAWLSVAVERTELLLCGVDLERILDKQGKAGMRRGLVDSVERLRKAPRNEIPSILEVLRRQAADLAQIPGVESLLVSCLDRATEDIDRVIDTIERKGESTGVGSAGTRSVGSRVSKRSGHGSRGGSRRSGKSGGSVGGGSSGRGGGSRSGGASSSRGGGGWEPDIEIDMLQVRAVQRRLGMLGCASDLSEEFKEELRDIRKALKQQGVCNVAIDGVVSDEANGELDARFSEHSQLLHRSVRSIDVRAAGLHACAERACSFFAAVASEMEAHEKREVIIDEKGEQRMFDCKEDFRLADEDREAAVTSSTDRVRMAADEKELEASFTRAMGLLDEVEESYREYHKTAYSAAAVHPAEAKEEALKIQAAMCSLIGLSPPADSAGCNDDDTAVSPSVLPAEIVEAVLDGGGGGEGQEAKDDNDEQAAPETATSVDNPTIAEQQTGEETGQKMPTIYRTPNGRGRGQAGSRIESDCGYVVRHTPAEIVEQLMASTDGGDDDDDDPLSGNESESACSNGEAESAERVDERTAGGGAGGVVGSDGGVVGMHGTDIDAPVYWRGSFVPLGNEEIEALKLEEGEEGLAKYFHKRDRRFRELSDEERDRLRLASEAIAAARVQAKEDAAKAAKKGGKKGGAKPKKAPKGTTAAAASTPAPEEDTEGDTEVEPPSVLEVYDAIREEVIQHISARKEEIARRRAEEKLVPRDPTGEAVMEELSMPVAEVADMVFSLRDDLVSRTEARSAARGADAEATCLDTQEILTEELEERLRKHWPRKGRTEVGARQPREGELHSHRQKARRFIRQVRDKLADQDKGFREELQKVAAVRNSFQEAFAGVSKQLPEAASVAALQGMESRCKRLLAGFVAEHEAFLSRLERLISDEPARLLASCDDVTRMCKRFADGGDYDDQELAELDVLLGEPREEISQAAVSRRGALGKVREEYEVALADEGDFKKEHARCVLELSLREGLGQRYGAPRRNAQERIRSAIMRDERCADTIQRLLNDLEYILSSSSSPSPLSPTPFNAENVTPKKNGDVDGIRLARRQDGEERPGGGGARETALLPFSVDQAAFSNTGGGTLTQQLRSTLLSLREALFRHASFLEFLPAPDRVLRNLAVPGREVESILHMGGGAMQEEGRKSDEDGEELDPEVTLMPQEGESFAGALNSLEARCRSETRLLYESEGKEESLGEGGIPESLRIWLKESRQRALTDGGHREEARRRLRQQVERFELLIAKWPVPRDMSSGPRAPALMLFDLSSRLERAACVARKTREEEFERAVSVWAAARVKHQRLLRPAFGSADRREELNQLLSQEEGRVAEAMQAIFSFRRGLLEQEAMGAREQAARISDCFGGVMTILDSVVMGDDLGKLPGDDDEEPKRKGLRRLRKAERALQKQARLQDEALAEPVTSGGGRKKSAAVAAINDANNDGPGIDTTATNTLKGQGRQWGRRKWKAKGLSDLARVLLAATTVVEATAATTAAWDESDSENNNAVAVDFDAIFDSTECDLDATPCDTSSAVADAAVGKGKGAAAVTKGGKTKKGVGTKEASAVIGDAGEEESEEDAAARRRKEEREAEVKGWAEGVRTALEDETFVTTAHRAAVAARDEILEALADRTRTTMTEIHKHYGKMLDAEVHWRTKWKQLVAFLTQNEDT